MNEFIFHLYFWSAAILFTAGMFKIKSISRALVCSNVRRGRSVNTLALYAYSFWFILMLSLMPIINTLVLINSICVGVTSAFISVINHVTVNS